MSTPVQIKQALLIFDSTLSRELGPALWAALIEIEQFYNHGSRRAEFQRFYLSSHAPSLNVFRSTVRSVGGLFGASAADAFSSLRYAHVAKPPIAPRDAKGPHANTFDQERIGEAVRQALAPSADDGFLLVVTDLEITPPRNWRYIIWDDIVRGTVISTAPLDPRYWRDPDKNRVEITKRRLRAAGMCITGEWLGLQRCGNPTCFLHRNVDAVAALDFMSSVGHEHHESGLAGRGFADLESAPAVIQHVTALSEEISR